MDHGPSELEIRVGSILLFEVIEVMGIEVSGVKREDSLN